MNARPPVKTSCEYSPRSVRLHGGAVVELPPIGHSAGPYGPPLAIQSAGPEGSGSESGTPSKFVSRHGVGVFAKRPFDQANKAEIFRSSLNLKLASASMPFTLTSAL